MTARRSLRRVDVDRAIVSRRPTRQHGRGSPRHGSPRASGDAPGEGRVADGGRALVDNPDGPIDIAVETLSRARATEPSGHTPATPRPVQHQHGRPIHRARTTRRPLTAYQITRRLTDGQVRAPSPSKPPTQPGRLHSGLTICWMTTPGNSPQGPQRCAAEPKRRRSSPSNRGRPAVRLDRVDDPRTRVDDLGPDLVRSISSPTPGGPPRPPPTRRLGDQRVSRPHCS